MTIDAGRQEVAQYVSRETLEHLDAYVALLREAVEAQNLISAATIPHIWIRHILDSLQLAMLVQDDDAWIDIGSGAGLPGLVVALASRRHVTLIEPRALRATFLEEARKTLRLQGRVEVIRSKADRVEPRQAGIISARAVAGIADIFAMSAHLAGADTRWILPRGRSAEAEVAQAGQLWQADFRLVTSLTDPEAKIVIASGVRPRTRR